MNNPIKLNEKPRVGEFLLDNIVTIIFVALTLLGFIVSEAISLNFFLMDLTERFFRNSFLVLSLIIPVIAGLGLNFGIVIGAMSGQIAIIIAKYFEIGGFTGLMFCFIISIPFAMLFGYLTGALYNKTKGQEMIASLMVGYFANGWYQFLFLFVVGGVIAVPATHPIIKPDGVGLRMTIDLGKVTDSAGVVTDTGLKDAMNGFAQIPLMWAVLICSVVFLLYSAYKMKKSGNLNKTGQKNVMQYINLGLCVVLAAFSLFAIVTNSSLMMVKGVPVVTALFIIALCVFTELIMKTKIGQDFKSVGQSQHIAEVSGINVNRTRIIATMISTVLAAWGMIIYLQDIGTLNTFNAHSNIGLFSVASILVGGASTSKASIKHALVGVLLFNSMFIMSPELGNAMFGSPLLGEYLRTFMAYGAIGVALGLYVWKSLKKSAVTLKDIDN